jgi:hypothetical protein
MENSNFVFKSDVRKAGFEKESNIFKNLTCLNYEEREVEKNSAERLNKFLSNFFTTRQFKGTEKEVILGIRNDEVTGKNTLVRLNLNTDPQKMESWDIKENIQTLDAAVFLKQYDDFTRDQERNVLFKSDVMKAGFEKESDTHKNLTCLNHDVQELKGDMLDDLNKFNKITQFKGTENEVILGIKNDEVTGKNTLVRINLGTNPQTLESWDIKENIQTLDAAVFLKQFDDFSIEQKNDQENKNVNKNLEGDNYLPEKAGLIAVQIAFAKKMGYVQGVCECVAAIGDDHTLGKKLLSEMNVTKDTAKKYASPETFKALEQGIFAHKHEQQIEQTHSIKR